MTFTDVAMRGEIACGVTGSGGVICWGGTSASDYNAAAPSGTGFAAIGTSSGIFYAGGSGSIESFSSAPLQSIPVSSPVVQVVETYALLQSGEVVSVSTGTAVVVSEQAFSMLDPGLVGWGLTPGGRLLRIVVPGSHIPD